MPADKNELGVTAMCRGIYTWRLIARNRFPFHCAELKGLLRWAHGPYEARCARLARFVRNVLPLRCTLTRHHRIVMSSMSRYRQGAPWLVLLACYFGIERNPCRAADLSEIGGPFNPWMASHVVRRGSIYRHQVSLIG